MKNYRRITSVLGIIAAIFALAGILFCLLPAVSIDSVIGSGSLSIFDYMFGAGDSKANAGLIIAFIFMIIGLLSSLVSAYIASRKTCKRGKKCDLFLTISGITGFAFLLTAGILIFCTIKLIGGSTGSIAGLATVSVGSGVIVSGIFLVLASLIEVPASLALIIDSKK